MKIVIATAVLICLVAGCASRNFVSHGIPNFRAVPDDSAIYRGGQPQSMAAWIYLKSLGVSNVVKLNLKSQGSDEDAIKTGMTVCYFPIRTPQQIALKPDPAVISNAVAAIKPGTFVHCEHGEDRTGLIIACRRTWSEGWKKSAARKEMLANGFHPLLHGLNDFWEDNVH